ncbi:hypothetical protein BG015_009917 [Linnemannia schmuckeri]|uniref:Uncharacterized protein n=1 Tax=Linnemannia schmuckeri TaxID=64567 RepID=A0A9P5RX93_9FUNG|nr:hypothetical protein BG015_009917 [Linnemannia schmuckeri]
MDSGSVAPVSDVKVFKEYPSRHSALPQRNIFNVEIVDSQSGIPQVLDSLQRSGPLHFRGWVPIEETKHASAKDSGKFVYIFGEIIEWTHQYDPSVTTAYEPYFAPLAKVCSYLDVLVQLVVEMRIKDALHVLIPQVAVLLAEPESMVSRMLQRHRKQLLELGASDSVIRGSNFYKSWVADQAADLAGSSEKSRASLSPDVSGHAEYDTFADDMVTITDSEIDVRSTHSNHNHRHSHPDDTDDRDVNATSPPPATSKPLLPIVSYDMADRDVIPEFETKVETYEELPAPCGDDFCFLHPVFKDVARNTISDDMRLLSSKAMAAVVTIGPSGQNRTWTGRTLRRGVDYIRILIRIGTRLVFLSRAGMSDHNLQHNHPNKQRVHCHESVEELPRQALEETHKAKSVGCNCQTTQHQSTNFECACLLDAQRKKELRPTSTSIYTHHNFNSLNKEEGSISSKSANHPSIFINIIPMGYIGTSSNARCFNEFGGSIRGTLRSSIVDHALTTSRDGDYS